jgi:hypothetical protein
MNDKTCKWYDVSDWEGGRNYETECGEIQYFVDGTVKKNKYKFCPYCGKKIEVISD